MVRRLMGVSIWGMSGEFSVSEDNSRQLPMPSASTINVLSFSLSSWDPCFERGDADTFCTVWICHFQAPHMWLACGTFNLNFIQLQLFFVNSCRIFSCSCAVMACCNSFLAPLKFVRWSDLSWYTGYITSSSEAGRSLFINCWILPSGLLLNLVMWKRCRDAFFSLSNLTMQETDEVQHRMLLLLVLEEVKSLEDVAEIGWQDLGWQVENLFCLCLILQRDRVNNVFAIWNKLVNAETTLVTQHVRVSFCLLFWWYQH